MRRVLDPTLIYGHETVVLRGTGESRREVHMNNLCSTVYLKRTDRTKAEGDVSH